MDLTVHVYVLAYITNTVPYCAVLSFIVNIKDRAPILKIMITNDDNGGDNNNNKNENMNGNDGDNDGDDNNKVLCVD